MFSLENNIGLLWDNIWKTKPLCNERKSAITKYQNRESELLNFTCTLTEKKITQDEMMKTAHQVWLKIPTDNKHYDYKSEHPCIGISTLQLASNYKQLYHFMKTDGFYLEHMSGTIFIHLHPHGLCYDFHWLSGDGLNSFLRHVKCKLELVTKTEQDKYGWFSTLYKLMLIQ